jgi:hypothetical protein
MGGIKARGRSARHGSGAARSGGRCYHAGVTAPRILPVLGLLLLSGCLTWSPWTPDQSPPDPETAPPSRAISLRLGASQSGDLDCAAAARCQQWFRVDAPRAGVLRLEVQLVGLREGAIARLVLQDGEGRSVGRASSADGLPLRVESAVERGVHAVLLQAGGGAVGYTIAAAFE